MGLLVAVAAADRLVHALSGIGHLLGLSAGLLGLLVALGADGPEVTSALLALFQGATDIGVGVVVGSNIYNLAGLLGLAAIVARKVPAGPYRVTLDGSANGLATALLGALLIVPGLRLLWGLGLLLIISLYTVAVALGQDRVLQLLHRGRHPEWEATEGPQADITQSLPRAMLVVGMAVVLIIAGSDLLVRESIYLGPKLGLPDAVVATFILPVATSLPNSWAAIALARRGLAAAAIASTFNSNSINAVFGAGVPALFLTIHASQAARTLDIFWLALMTCAAILLMALRWTLSRWEGSILVGLYIIFVVVRLLTMRL